MKIYTRKKDQIEQDAFQLCVSATKLINRKLITKKLEIESPFLPILFFEK